MWQVSGRFSPENRIELPAEGWLRLDPPACSDLSAPLTLTPAEPAGLEGEFVASWDAMESFYDDVERKSPGCSGGVGALLGEIREAGFDQLLRAGQSLTTLILTRAKRHGSFEHYVRFAPTVGGVRVEAELPSGAQTFPSGGDLTPAVRSLVDELAELRIE